MKFRHLIFPALLFFAVAATSNNDTELDAINKVLDDFHDAAAHGDQQRYLDHFTEDGVFLGTDEWERWPKHPDFTDYVGSRFKDGVGWNYKSVERAVSISASSDIAWFDEVLFSEQNGRFRGTGVLARQDGRWKVAHYAMSFLILNENWDEVIELTRNTNENKEP
jgi:ketosteroid isomerase-like protein